ARELAPGGQRHRGVAGAEAHGSEPGRGEGAAAGAVRGWRRKKSPFAPSEASTRSAVSPSSPARSPPGSGAKPRNAAPGRYGSATATAARATLATRSGGEGRLREKARLVRSTSST